MAAITAGVVAVAGAYGAHRQARAAEEGAELQARGVEAAQRDTRAATDRARQFMLTGQNDPTTQAQIEGNVGARPQGGSFWDNLSGKIYDMRLDDYLAQNSPQAQNQNPSVPTGQNPFRPILESGQTPINTGTPDPRTDYLSGQQQGMALTNLGYQTAGGTLSPVAQMAQPYLDEQSALLGMQGTDARNAALSRVSDPLAAEQERALLRNNAALGGVGGNILSQLAEQTRARTEANIGNRLGQLSSASLPALNALQNLSNLQLNRGLNLSDIARTTGSDLSRMETNRRQALANLEIGQGSQMAQLSQNLGNAQGNYYAHAASNAPAITQGIMAGASAYGGGGGFSGFGGGSSPFSQFLMNTSSGYGNIGDPFSG